MRRMLRIIRWLLILLVILVLIGSAGGYVWLRRSLPQTSGMITVAGIRAPIEIVRDTDAVPHIFAASRNDALFGLGFVHAQERLWQMEFQRRIGQGRLSEMLGESTAGTDRFLRTLGVYRAAQQAWTTLSPDARSALDAYCAGINAFLATRPALSPEFMLTGASTPEPWAGPDVLVWQKMMAWDLGGNYGNELLRTDLIRAVGADRMQALMPGYPEDGTSIVAELPIGQYSGLLDLGADVRALMGLSGYSGEGLGSNNWVVDGTRSTTGKPLLADDPHLATRVPSIWFLAHLSAPDYEVIGATIPGLPGIVIGRNRSIAWGVTNVGPDVQDLFRERIDSSGRMAEFRGQMEPITVIEDTLRVKGQPDEPLTIRVTRHGPLISDALNRNREDVPPEDRAPEREALAFRWTALDPDDTTFEAFLGINEAQSWDEFTQALSRYVAPAQNFVYADVDGNIGYYAPGRYPIRASGDGSMPAEGWSGSAEWTGSVPFDEQPHVFNPPEHYVVTANNKPVPPDYPYLLGREWAWPYRADRITALLRAKDKLSPDDLAAIQADTVSLHARELLPQILPMITPETDNERAAIELLQQWDGDTRGDSAAAALMQAWYARLPEVIAGDELGETLSDRYQGQFTFVRPFVGNVLRNPNDPWCDDTATAQPERCPAIVADAFRDALADLRDRLGNDMRRWRWDALHTVMFAHQPFDSVAALRPLFSRTQAHGGDNSTVNVGPFDLTKPFEQRHIPGYRQIIDMADANSGRFIHAVGQSGHILSPHYADYIADWQAVRYRPMRFDRSVIDGAAQATLRLTP